MAGTKVVVGAMIAVPVFCPVAVIVTGTRPTLAPVVAPAGPDPALPTAVVMKVTCGTATVLVTIETVVEDDVVIVTV